MLKQIALSAVAAATIAGAMIAPTVPAQAAAHFGVYIDPGIPPPGPGNCWVYNHHRHRWVWACSSPQYVQPVHPFFDFSFNTGPNYHPRPRF